MCTMPDQEAVLSTQSPAAAVPAAAFFDVDNTLLHGSSLFLFGRGAVRERIITLRELLQFAYKQFRFKRVGENLSHMKSFQEQALRLIAGRSVAELEESLERVCDTYVIPKIWPEALELIEREKANGRDVWLITATPIQIADEIARQVGATGALATVPAEDDGVFTGELAGPVVHAEVKTQVATRLAHERGYSLPDSSAYSDSANDVTLLALVGHPFATNPDAKLRAIARQRSWPVIFLHRKGKRRRR